MAIVLSCHVLRGDCLNPFTANASCKSSWCMAPNRACAHVTASKDAGNHEKIRGWISLSANPRWKQACAEKAEKVRLERCTVSAYRDGAGAPLH